MYLYPQMLCCDAHVCYFSFVIGPMGVLMVNYSLFQMSKTIVLRCNMINESINQSINQSKKLRSPFELKQSQYNECTTRITSVGDPEREGE